MSKVILTHADIVEQAMVLENCIPSHSKIYGVPRGGIPVAYLLSSLDSSFTIVDRPEDADVIVDDIIDSGATRNKYADKPFYALYGRESGNYMVGEYRSEWLVFPWEGTLETSAEDIGFRLLQFIGEDVERGGLIETPKRFIKAWTEWTSGYGVDLDNLFKCFADGSEDYDEMIVVDPIPFCSHCEHHLAAIFGTVHIAYIPNKQIAGLSKFCRLVDAYAYRLQVQERLTTQIANFIESALQPVGLAVMVKARHFCMESRGVKKSGVFTTTTSIKGAMKDLPAARAEFFSMVNG